MKGNAGNDGSKLDQDIDPGEPIASLAGFGHEASSGFLSRFRRAIQRRTMVGQLTTFTTSTPLVVLMEFWLILMDQFSPKSTRKDGRREDKTS
jgi:hypothetical protein